MKVLSLLCLYLFLTNVLSAQNRYDVVIDEIMADPTPQIGLPNNEWLELKNTSSSAVNLQGWRIA
ncbi:MAG: lamin tail domain-containing protein, partial [Chitinophagaceae bacterium]